MPGGRPFLALDLRERRDALLAAADRSGKSPQVLEKDVWVVWALRTLFDSPHGCALAFKGGTSLSKAYQLIDRFSEDVDLTYDIRRLIPLPPNEAEVHPQSNSQADKLTKEVRKKLPEFVKGQILPVLKEVIATEGLPVQASFDAKGSNVDIYLEYESALERAEYIEPRVKLEFGARSTGEPVERKDVVCDAAAFLQGVEFPVATPRVMLAVRTFWEKATLAHAFCSAGGRADRHSRHWYDLLQVYRRHPKYCSDREIADQVVRHKSRFLRYKDVDYSDVLRGELRLVPQGEHANDLRADFVRMCEGGFLPLESMEFDRVLDGCREVEACINQALAVANPPGLKGGRRRLLP